MSLLVSSTGHARWRDRGFRAAIGRAGIAPDKREGDGATPIGSFPIRNGFWRADRLARPATAIALAAIDPADGWCDDPGDPTYNRAVRLPYAGRHERLWRADGLYDLVLVLGYNDDPVVAGRGSAIFLHCAAADFGPTEGCVALALDDLRVVIAGWRAEDRVVVLS
ncbi:MAG: hypothetical protein FJX67_17275 [Alphaproteobacteria bacterium]|nr:hypothetical protein [Alphaproteobacteria bacterium]